MDRIKLPREELPIFRARFEVHSHVSKKNNRPIHKNMRTGKVFLGKGRHLQDAERIMVMHIERAKSAYPPGPIVEDVHCCFRFYFNDYYTKEVERRKNMPDLSNLFELPQDVLQKCGVIKNDSQIVSLDGSRRLPGVQNIIEIWIWKAEK